MEAVISYAKTVLFFLLFANLVMQLLKGSSYERFVHPVCGMILVILIVRPILGLFGGEEKVLHAAERKLSFLLARETPHLMIPEDAGYEFAVLEAYEEESGKGQVRHVLIRTGFTSKEIMVCLVINGRGRAKKGQYFVHQDKLIDVLTKIPGMTSISVSINTENTNVIMGKEIYLLWGSPTIQDVIHVRDMEKEGYPFTGQQLTFKISPLSFYQVNPVQTEKLYSLALQYAGLTGKETINVHVDESVKPRDFLKVTATDEDGNVKEFEVLVRFDSEVEIDYYRHGGILPMVLRDKLQSKRGQQA